MSLLGQKRTNHRGPKSAVVRFGPKADKILRRSERSDVPIATNAPQHAMYRNMAMALFDPSQ
jgi:hypothetical protein